MFYKIGVLKNTCAGLSVLIKLQPQGWKFIEKEILVQMFSGEFCQIFKKIYFLECFGATASAF